VTYKDFIAEFEDARKRAADHARLKVARIVDDFTKGFDPKDPSPALHDVGVELVAEMRTAIEAFMASNGYKAIVQIGKLFGE